LNQLKFGSVTVDRVVEAEGPGFTPEFLLPASSEEAIRAERDWLVPHFYAETHNRFIQSMHSFVIRTDHHTVLIDTCIGNDKDRPSTRAWHQQQKPYLERLHAIGVHEDEIDFVMCTHLHVDHVGWNTKLENGHWVPTFPNARYLFHKLEYQWLEASGFEASEFEISGLEEQRSNNRGDQAANGRGSGDGFFEDSVLPVVRAGQSELIDADYTLDDTLSLDPTPGHSPGHVCINLTSQGKNAVFAGDLLHHPIQCAYPEWNSRFCWDQEMSAEQRTRFVSRYVDQDVVILPAHFASPVAGHITGNGARCKFSLLKS
jgi:glyoxylase-like metal-dependent hydrolase (beta-lactamase superfamily II)